jgi:hypothetical protein
MAKNLILFQFFSDTLQLKSKKIKHLPFKYDFEDCMGEHDWTKQFVAKTLATNSGQCHSLPLLYLILAEEIGAKAQLSCLPNHSFIKFQDDNGIYYNIELSNGMMTTDAFLMQTGYITTEAIQNKIFLQPLNEQQLLSRNLSDLASGYLRKNCYDAFVATIIEKSLEIDPNNISAHTLKSNHLTYRFQYVAAQLNLNERNYRYIIEQYPKAKQFLIERNKQYEFIDKMGYNSIAMEEYKKFLEILQQAKQEDKNQEKILKLNKTVKHNK